jgi:hypothetical protein
VLDVQRCVVCGGGAEAARCFSVLPLATFVPCGAVRMPPVRPESSSAAQHAATARQSRTPRRGGAARGDCSACAPLPPSAGQRLRSSPAAMCRACSPSPSSSLDELISLPDSLASSMVLRRLHRSFIRRAACGSISAESGHCGCCAPGEASHASQVPRLWKLTCRRGGTAVGTTLRLPLRLRTLLQAQGSRNERYRLCRCVFASQEEALRSPIGPRQPVQRICLGTCRAQRRPLSQTSQHLRGRPVHAG